MTARTPTSHPKQQHTGWAADDSAALYQLAAWGQGYFGVSADGTVVVRTDTTPEHQIDLLEVVQSLRERDLTTPILIRFSNILAHRLLTLHDAFADAIRENDYQGRYTAVFPIKVNQQRPVVEEVYRYGQEYEFGLEVGSKPELLAVLAMTGDSTERLVVCNGFKDDAYIEAVVLASKLGRPIIPVIENFAELDRVLRHSEAYGVRPRLGVRAKLASQGAGRWSGSTGEQSKFGLFISEILRMVDILRERDMLDCLTLLHCHAGSQIQDIHRLKQAVGELSHVYGELVRLGAGLKYLDVGGGLGVDYDGSQTNYPSSMNYTLREYASEIVYRIGSICDEREIAHPVIVSESGRAMAAYQSVLVFNVVGATGPVTLRRSDRTVDPADELPQPVRDLLIAWESVVPELVVECYHDAVQAREQALNLFSLGYMTIEQRGLAERTFLATCTRIAEAVVDLPSVPEELDGLSSILSETYFCNLSIFQSMPDVWAIEQLFPIMPIHRLDEKPTHQAVLADITCDSDGRIDRFVDARSERDTLDVHELRDDEEYFLAAFLVGAYQETLGDLHNLFGATHVVHIRVHDEGGWWIEETVRGDTAREVLAYVQYDVDRLAPQLARDCELAIRSGRLTLSESRTLLRFYENALDGYTYLEPE